MALDAKEITRLGADLTKASAASEPGDVMIKMLNDLRKGVTASEDLLRSTKIGITVNKFKTHRNPEVAKVAADLVLKWRNDVKAAGGGSKGAGAAGAGAASPASGSGKSTPVGTGTPSRPASAKANANGAAAAEGAGKTGFKASVPLDKRTSVTDKMDTARTGNDIRDNCLKLMYDGLCNMSEEPPQTVLNHAISIEAAAYAAYAPETSEAYKSKMRSLFQNLKNKSNPGLRLRIFAGEIAPERFVRMSLEELKSKERREEDKQIQKENMDKAMVAQEEKSISSSLTCGKCHQKKVSYSQAQTRSADEPMTTFCECTVCGHRWKFS